MSQDLSVLLSEMNVGDRRAPGCEKKVVQIATADYEHKKLLATKAMQHKPMGEPRTPNSVWSGMYLYRCQEPDPNPTFLSRTWIL